MKNKMILGVTNDEYELPVYIEDSYRAMAEVSGVHYTSISRQCRGISKGSMGELKFVEIEDE